MAAHDLRNPLSVIKGYSAFLLDDSSGLSAQHRKFVAKIASSSDSMLRLLEDLLDLSAVESGKLELTREPVALAELLERAVELARVFADQKGIEIGFARRDEVSDLALDVVKIEQVLTNLLSNAVKYSHRGTRVDVSLIASESTVILRVVDQGQGIPADEIERLFTPFAKLTVKATAGEKSTGLGLAIVRRIVEGHRGRIWVKSEPGRGSIFSVELPTEPAPDEPSRREAAPLVDQSP